MTYCNLYKWFAVQTERKYISNSNDIIGEQWKKLIQKSIVGVIFNKGGGIEKRSILDITYLLCMSNFNWILLMFIIIILNIDKRERARMIIDGGRWKKRC